MAKKDELEEQLDALIKPGGGTSNFGADPTKAIVLLGKTVIRLDRTSTRLSTVTIWLTVVILLVSIVQVVLMLRRK
jgi:hypothetical protein